jgi:predicted site-specific integrase-resolvase
VDVKQIRVWLESGELKGFRATGGPWKIPREEISAFAKRRKGAP